MGPPKKKIWKFPSQCPVFPYFWVDGHPRKRSTDAVILKTNVATLEVTYLSYRGASRKTLFLFVFGVS